MTPERLGPFLLYERLESDVADAYRARRVVAPGHLSAPLLVEVFRAAPRKTAEALVETAVWGARVAHPGVARILEVGTHRDRLYAVSELVRGRDLGAVLRAAASTRVAVSVPAALAIGAQLARLGREIHEERGGEDLLGAFRPRDIVLGFNGRVRVRARGTFDGPVSRETRDPFVAPELARGAQPGPRADAWTVARVLRAVLATDPEGRKTPKVSTLYKDSLGPILTGALARDPDARLSLMALERRLLDVLLDTADNPTRVVVELLEEQAGGALPREEESLTVDDLGSLASEPTAGPARELLFPRTSSAARARERVDTEVGPSPLAAAGDGDSSLFGRVLAEAEREIAEVSDDGEPFAFAASPHAEPSARAERSLQESLVADLDDGGHHHADLVDAELDVGDLDDPEPDDAELDVDLDAIARLSLDGESLGASASSPGAASADEVLSMAGTAVVDRPPALPASAHEDGDVFQAPSAATRVSRVSSRERSSVSRDQRSSPGSYPRGDPPETAPELAVFGARDKAAANRSGASDAEAELSRLDNVFTRTVRPAELLPELRGDASTGALRSGSKSGSGERPNDPSPARSSSQPSSTPSVPPLDPDKTAYLDNPAGAFESPAASGAEGGQAGHVPVVYDDDDEQLTERLPEDLIKEAIRLASQGRPPTGASSTSAAETNARDSNWGQPLVSVPGPERPDTTVLLPVHDVRQILSARGGLDAEMPEGQDPPTLDQLLPEDPELGLLVVEVPDGAVVFMNGDQRGKGRTVIEQLDRFASFVVRVHHRGHLPWTGTVTLQGMRAARIEPELRRR